MPERDRFPGYDVLAKRRSPSWNEQTRAVINQRLAVPREPRFLAPDLFAILAAACDRIVPQPAGRVPVPVAAYIDQKLFEKKGDGYRLARMPEQGEAYRRALSALEKEAQHRHSCAFIALQAGEQDQILAAAQRGALRDGAWGDMPSDLFFAHRLLTDVTSAYWAHPTAWSEMGFGGPASPRGYVRMGLNRHDPWEAAEAESDTELEDKREGSDEH